MSLWYHENTTLKHNRERKQYLVCHDCWLYHSPINDIKNTNTVAVPSAEPMDPRYSQRVPALHPGLCSVFTDALPEHLLCVTTALPTCWCCLFLHCTQQYMTLILSGFNSSLSIAPYSMRRPISYHLWIYSQDPVQFGTQQKLKCSEWVNQINEQYPFLIFCNLLCIPLVFNSLLNQLTLQDLSCLF